MSKKMSESPAPVKTFPRKKKDDIPYPVRINRYLALMGVATRRATEELIVQGKVTINNRVAVLTDRVLQGDEVVVKGQKPKAFRYIAYHKKRGILTHSEKERSGKAIADVMPTPGVYPIGRLDKESEGLIILTDDGRITERLLSPRYDHQKEYLVTVQERLRNDMIEAMERGIVIEDGPTKPCTIVKKGPNTISMTITEGRKHQIRRMLSAVGGTVIALKRVRIMNVTLGTLAPGASRNISGTEKEEFLSSLGLK